jgi:hypothetical protein
MRHRSGSPGRSRVRRRTDRFHRHPPPKLGHVTLEHGRPSAVVHELPISPRLDQAGARQLFQMVRDGRLPNRETAAKALATNLALPRDVFEDFEPARVGQRFRDSLELLGVQGRPGS